MNGKQTKIATFGLGIQTRKGASTAASKASYKTHYKAVSIGALVLCLSASLAAVPALAADNVSYGYATVIDSQPVYTTVQINTPREECWQEQVVYEDRRRNSHPLGTVVGGVIGGALGNAVGHRKSNKRVGAVVGAVLGATLGNVIASSNAPSQRRYETQERCKVYQDSREEERLVGYQVRYRYNEQTYSTRMDANPGDTIKVRLAISPVI
ncbi:MAG: hypothetical protein ACI9SB_001786 [Candidatus Azotimanducaceae bacterium]|jgi:uncharacterized protein YcfJ